MTSENRFFIDFDSWEDVVDFHGQRGEDFYQDLVKQAERLDALVPALRDRAVALEQATAYLMETLKERGINRFPAETYKELLESLLTLYDPPAMFILALRAILLNHHDPTDLLHDFASQVPTPTDSLPIQ